jgi:hypothetical protein
MITDTEIRTSGLRILNENLGTVEAERFISLIQREPIDYTEWQKNLFEDRSIEEISEAAMKLRRDQGSN